MNDVIPSSEAYAQRRGYKNAALGKQRGAMNSKEAVESLFGFGMGKDALFQQARQFCNDGELPFDAQCVDADMQFACEWTMGHQESLASCRKKFQGAFLELARRCSPLTTQLQRFRLAHGSRLAAPLAGIVVVLCFVMAWSEWRLAWDHIEGFGIVEDMPVTGLWRAVDEPEPMPMAELFAANAAMREEFRRSKPDEHVDFVYQSVRDERDKGWCSDFLTEAQVNQLFPDGWAAVPSFYVCAALWQEAARR